LTSTRLWWWPRAGRPAGQAGWPGQTHCHSVLFMAIQGRGSVRRK
jgi:hypothetical protein